MVVSAAQRAAKYAAKNVGDVVKNRVDAQKTNMEANQLSAANVWAAVDVSIKQICDTNEIESIMQAMYMSYGRKVKAIVLKHSGVPALNEVCRQYTLFEDRGLDSSTLVDIALQIGEVDINACT